MKDGGPFALAVAFAVVSNRGNLPASHRHAQEKMMGVLLVGLEITRSVTVRHRREEHISDPGIRADLMLFDDEAASPDFFRVRVETQLSEPLPPMTPDQTVEWLRDILKRML